MDATILKAFFLLTLSVGVIGLMFFLLKKYSPKLNRNANLFDIKIKGKTSLTPKSHLFVVNVEGNDLLIGVTESNITTLKELNQFTPPQHKESTEPTAKMDFASIFNNADKSDSINSNPVKLKESKIDKFNQEKQNKVSPDELVEDLSFKSFLKNITRVG
jgi:flagellar biogenesis protein FliO